MLDLLLKQWLSMGRCNWKIKRDLPTVAWLPAWCHLLYLSIRLIELLPVVCILQGYLLVLEREEPQVPWLLLEDCLVQKAFILGVLVCTVLHLLWQKNSPKTGGDTPFLKPFSLDPSTLFHGCLWILSLSDSYQCSSGQLRQVGIITGPPGSLCVCAM